MNTTFSQQRTFDPSARIGPLVGDVLGYIDLPQLSFHQRARVQQLGNRHANYLVNSGLINWPVLTGLQKLAGGKSLSRSEKVQLKTRLYPLADTQERTGRSYVSERSLERAFWTHLR